MALDAADAAALWALRVVGGSPTKKNALLGSHTRPSNIQPTHTTGSETERPSAVPPYGATPLTLFVQNFVLVF